MKRLYLLLFTGLTALSLTFTQMTSAADLYVATNGTGGGSSWADATNSIQGAIVAISSAYVTNTVWVSNGVYDTGGVSDPAWGEALTNRVLLNKAITVRSANNDPAKTIIKGAWDGTSNGPAAVRCVKMFPSSTLIGFTLTNGATMVDASGYDGRGGGVYCNRDTTFLATISNCVIVGNLAHQYAGGAYLGALYNCSLIDNNALGYGSSGGGASSANMYDCILTGNSAESYGGGANAGTLYNCTIASNKTFRPSANGGGGTRSSALFNCLVIANTGYVGGVFGGTAYNSTIVGNSGSSTAARDCTLYNCIVYFNNANYYSTGINFTNCCTTPAKSEWATGNITNDPLFIANGSGYGTDHIAGNYRLGRGSPCINAGANQWMTNACDLEGARRIRYGVVDMGAYERMHAGTIYNFR